MDIDLENRINATYMSQALHSLAGKVGSGDHRHAVDVGRLLEGGLAPSQVGIGVPASTRAAGSGYVSPSVVNNAIDCLTRGTNCGSFKPSRTYPGLRGALTWSTNWDQTAGNTFSSTVGPHVHGLP